MSEERGDTISLSAMQFMDSQLLDGDAMQPGIGETLRVNGTAAVSAVGDARDAPEGAVFVVRVTATAIFPNCPRYIHRMQLVEHSVYAPREGCTPPVPAWKTFDAFRDALPERDRSPPDAG